MTHAEHSWNEEIQLKVNKQYTFSIFGSKTKLSCKEMHPSCKPKITTQNLNDSLLTSLCRRTKTFLYEFWFEMEIIEDVQVGSEEEGSEISSSNIIAYRDEPSRTSYLDKLPQKKLKRKTWEKQRKWGRPDHVDMRCRIRSGIEKEGLIEGREHYSWAKKIPAKVL